MPKKRSPGTGHAPGLRGRGNLMLNPTYGKRVLRPTLGICGPDGERQSLRSDH